MKGKPILLTRGAKHELEEIMAALRAGRVTLVALLAGEEVVVPREFLRGNWHLVRSRANDDASYLVATGPNDSEVGPRYYAPRFGPPLQ